MGLKRGLWTPEEDHILMSYIQTHGHDNWRALPKQAGLQRCGKSCRLRWVNYLRPDIKRGNITTEEEETIIKLHQILGNRWSAIAARLPGRTDNEIKNVWHTYLKKHHKTNYSSCSHNPNTTATSDNMLLGVGKNAGTPDSPAATEARYEGSGGGCCSTSPQHSSCSAELFSLTATDSWESSVSLPLIDECLQSDNPATMAVFPSACEEVPERANCSNSVSDCDVGFWYNLYLRAGELAATESRGPDHDVFSFSLLSLAFFVFVLILTMFLVLVFL